jgi:hypothetical protein
MRIFIAGVMQGSLKDKGMESQDYREAICQLVNEIHPDYETYDPFSLFPDSVKYDTQRARQVLLAMAEEAGKSDVVVAYLPEASMGTALEMIRAYDNGKPVISISPMAENWVVRALSQLVFATFAEFSDWARNGGFGTL